jgi:hypothetical protein
MKACPICSSKNLENFICVRCGSELSQLVNIENRSYYNLRQAIYKLIKQEYNNAFILLKKAYKLKKTILAEVLLNFCQQKVNLMQAGDQQKISD